MFGAKTLFHELLELIQTTIVDDVREKFYLDLLHIVGRHGIHLHFLMGEDPRFDTAFEQFKNKNIQNTPL